MSNATGVNGTRPPWGNLPPLNGHGPTSAWPGTPDYTTASAATRNADREIIYSAPRNHGWGWAGWLGSKITLGGVLLTVAALFLLGLAATQGFVSYSAQYVFVFAAKHAALPARLEAVGLDAGAVIFALLAVALAKLGRRATVERLANLACALGSMSMNLLGANLGSPRSVAVYVMPPALYALGSDRFISVIRRQALGPVEDERQQRSAWSRFGRFTGQTFLYSLRFVLAPPSTAKGVRRLVLEAAPLPEITPVITDAPVTRKPVTARTRKAITRTSRAGSKTARFLELVTDKYGDPSQLDRSQVGPVTRELAGQAGIDQGNARTVLYRAIAARQES
jgi:hypothetical protein